MGGGNKKKRPKMEYRYYEIPAGSPVLALLEKNGCRITEETSIIFIFTIIWKSVFVMTGRDI